MQGPQHRDRCNRRAGKLGRDVRGDGGEAQNIDVQHLARPPRRLEILAAVVSQAQVQALSRRGLLDHVGMAFELVADRGPDEIRAVRVEAFLHHQIDLTEIDKTKIDRDFFRVGRLSPDFVNVAWHRTTIQLASYEMVHGWPPSPRQGRASTRSRHAGKVNAIGYAVIHNSGVYAELSPGTPPGGHPLAPYMLTALIGPPGRLVSSGLHRGGEGSLDDLDWTKRAWDPTRAADLEIGLRKGCEELEWDQVDLPQIGKSGSAAGEIAVPHEGTGMGVAFDAVAFHQEYAVLCRLAEVVPAIGGDRHHPSLERQIVATRRQAARASERRFWRR